MNKKEHCSSIITIKKGDSYYNEKTNERLETQLASWKLRESAFNASVTSPRLPPIMFLFRLSILYAYIFCIIGLDHSFRRANRLVAEGANGPIRRTCLFGNV